MRGLKISAAVILMVVTGVTGLLAQAAPSFTGTPLQASRRELEQILAEYEQSAGSNAYSAALRGRAKYEASMIRQRLENGDFQVGDRITLMVEDEPTLSDTLTVTPDIEVLLPTDEKLSLKRVLRSEVQERLEQAIARVVKQPTVRSETYMRVTILGAVGRQGFYELRSDALLTDVLNQVGLPSNAILTKMSVERNNKTIWDGAPLQEALIEGRTLDQLNLRAGDVIKVPSQSTSGGLGRTLQNARALLMLIPVYFAVRRVGGW